MKLGAIPYYRQETAFSCGAACLQMAYATFGISLSQSEIWNSIQPAPSGAGASVQRLAQHAIGLNLSALVVQARNPWGLARRCTQLGRLTIVNHRPQADAPIGHFSLLSDVGEHDAIMHDPLYGQARRIVRATMIESWTGRPADRNPGSMLIVLGRPDPGNYHCSDCHAPLKRECVCPACRQTVRLDAVVDCTAYCSNRSWECVHCPNCDAELTSLADHPYSVTSLFGSLGFRDGVPGGS